MEYPLISEKSSFNAAILADGEYPTNETALSILQNTDIVVCCDGAAKNYNGKPYAIIGDGDSLSDDFKKQNADIFHQVDEQEDNDLTKATKFIISHLVKEGKALTIAYLGCTGKREDHTLGNISLMVRYFNELGVLPTMITDYGYFTPANGTATFDTMPNQQISIFNFGCSTLESNGLRWNSYPYKTLWQGTLNEAVGNSFSITANGGYLVYRTFEIK